MAAGKIAANKSQAGDVEEFMRMFEHPLKQAGDRRCDYRAPMDRTSGLKGLRLYVSTRPDGHSWKLIYMESSAVNQ